MSVAGKSLTAPKELMRPPEEFFNPTLLMFLVAVVILTVSTVGFFRWHWVDWCCFTLNVIALHLVGTVIHDACHNAAHRNRIINALLGHGSALMLGFSFPVFTRVHMQHHANVNDPKNDPDHVVSTFGPLWLINARFFYHEIFFFQRRLWRKLELLEWFVGRAIVGLIVYLGVRYDFLGYVFNFWFVPLAIVGLLLGLFFDYLPHRPFQERDRWLNARVYPSRILNLLIGGQNYHLIHHLWPSIPWYKYQQAYYQVKPLLDEKGSHQSLGILKSPKDFFGFLYDILIGIRFHPRSKAKLAAAEGTPAPPMPELTNSAASLEIEVPLSEAVQPLESSHVAVKIVPIGMTPDPGESTQPVATSHISKK